MESLYQYVPRNDTIHRLQIQTANNVAENFDFNFFKNDFLTFKSLNTLNPYQKFVQIGNAHNLGSGFIWKTV